MLEQEETASRPHNRHDTKESKYDSSIYFGEEGGVEAIKDKLTGGKYNYH